MINSIDQDTYIKKNKDHLKTYGSILDYIISDPDIASKSNVGTYENNQLTSDHIPIKCEYNLNSQNENILSINKKKIIRQYNKTNWEEFKNILTDYHEKNETITDINETERKITNIISTALQKCAPTIKNYHYKKPALPSFILDLITSRKRAEKKYLREKTKHNNSSRSDLDYLIKEIRFQIIQFESSSWKNFVEKQGPNPMSSKPWWKRINRFRKKRNNGIPTLFVNNKELKTDIEKADAK